ncbi:MAG TPA: CHAT domain-containing protein [Thermoanaerobaculia bacterium]|nr:CHAT domain-containing protein [Thermoanaerobaculia bacterium]
MRHVGFEVFRRTPEEWDLRFSGPEGNERRALKPAAIESLVKAVDESYAAGPRDLAQLGQHLYEWLDGPERWLGKAREGTSGLAIDVDVDGRLRQLPWELLADGGCYLADSLVTPVRRVGQSGAAPDIQNRPLRVLLMACSPKDVQPVLDFEKEESLVLKETREQPIELLVEESGSLVGLEREIVSFESGHFDVFHLSGHAGVVEGRPKFLMEDEFGRRQEAEAEDIAEAFAERWPRLLFLSGCRTGQATDHGALPSLCESLVRAGAPAVLGWALPVGDAAASIAAKELYRLLATGEGIAEAVARTRKALHKQRLSDWHLLRLYADRTPLSPLVTPLKTPGRQPFKVRGAKKDFIDAEAKVEVCSREDFVGRRRLLQRSLAVLKSNQQESLYADGLLLYGMGGLGKSSAAVRLCERLQDLARLVWVGRVDEESFLDKLRDKIEDTAELERLNDRRLPLKTRLRLLLGSQFATAPALFVFDDFEHNLACSPDAQPVKPAVEIDVAKLRELDSVQALASPMEGLLLGDNGRIVLEPAALKVLTAVLGAISESASPSRVLITCRHRFELPGPALLHAEALESMRGAELDKKLLRMAEREGENGAAVPLTLEAVTLAAGNPRLLERMRMTLAAAHSRESATAPKLEPVAESFRQEMRLAEWVARQGREGRLVLALLSAFDWPVERSVLESVAAFSLDPHLNQAAAVGLVEMVQDTRRETSRYYVSPLLCPLLAPELAQTQHAEKWKGIAWRAVEYFQENKRSEVAEQRDTDLLIAAYNLFIATSNHEAAAKLLIEQLDPYLMGVGAYSRLIDLHNSLSSALITPQLTAMSAIEVANARLARGETELAAERLRSALAVASEIHDPLREAIALNGLGGCHLELCDYDRAIPPLEQAATLARQEGWDGIELVASENIAWCYELKGNCAKALELFEALRQRAAEHRMELEEISSLLSEGNCHAALGDTEKALSFFEKVLTMLDGREPQIWGTTLHSQAEALIDVGKLGAAIAAAESGCGIGLRIDSPKLQIQNYSALARAFLLARQSPLAEDAASKATKLDVPFYGPYVNLLLGLSRLCNKGGTLAAGHSFTAALSGADTMLAKCPQNLMALETKALASAGSATLDTGSFSSAAEEALQVAREMHSRYCLVGSRKRFEALLALLDPKR